ncbi:MAG: GTPase domain-containing protein [Candidatus Sericytochromatia bacterium]|nr:GTPase domain-containing protein [Candidatus Tanganyikabacteria bacterium]
MMSTSVPGMAPAAWSRWVDTLAHFEAATAGGAAGKAQRRLLESRVRKLRTELAGTASPGLPKGTPHGLEAKLRELIGGLRAGQARLVDDVAAALEDIEQAAENEDRLVVLVFGEVNAGKTALALHMAGWDFDVPRRGRLFCGPDLDCARRLVEFPVEATREYQGFRLPGLLWIDCPGVSSCTAENARLARRLVSRADLILFVTSSDAPFKPSEMAELARLVRAGGSPDLAGLLVITQFDEALPDYDPATRKVTWSLVRKGSYEQQAAWALESLREAGLAHLVADRPPLAVSTHLARETLGLEWTTGKPLRVPAAGWEPAYAASGIPALCAALDEIVKTRGRELKASWPQKREAALSARLEDTFGGSLAALAQIGAQLDKLARDLDLAGERAAQEASERAAGRVAPCLGGNGIYRGDFDAKTARRELADHLRRRVDEAVRRHAGRVLDSNLRSLDRELAAYDATIRLEIDLQRKTRTIRRTSTTRGRAVGGATGAAAGTLAGAWAGAEGGAALGTLFLPGLGTAIGGILGGLLGAVFGGAGGRAVGRWAGAQVQETQVVEVPAGSNAADVVDKATRKVGKAAGRLVRERFALLKGSVVIPLQREVKALADTVEGWLATFGTPHRAAGSRRAS